MRLPSPRLQRKFRPTAGTFAKAAVWVAAIVVLCLMTVGSIGT